MPASDNFLCNDATTTAAVLISLQNLYDHAHEDEWSNDAYTDIVWNVGDYDGVCFEQVRNDFQDYMRTTGFHDLFEGSGWSLYMEVVDDATPLRLRLVRVGQNYDDFPDRRNFIDLMNPLQLNAVRHIRF